MEVHLLVPASVSAAVAATARAELGGGHVTISTGTAYCQAPSKPSIGPIIGVPDCPE